MSVSPLPARVLSELDHIRIANLLKQPGMDFAADLAALLDAAELLSPRALPSDLVTMNSRVRIADHQAGNERELTLCYPHDTNPDTGFVSVLSPVGTSLLGLREGALAHWPMPSGAQASARILKVLYQPEDHGEFLR